MYTEPLNDLDTAARRRFKNTFNLCNYEDMTPLRPGVAAHMKGDSTPGYIGCTPGHSGTFLNRFKLDFIIRCKFLVDYEDFA